MAQVSSSGTVSKWTSPASRTPAADSASSAKSAAPTPPLHVARAATVDAAVPDLGREGRARPALPRRHDVDVAVDHERTTTPRSAERADGERTVPPVVPARHHRVVDEVGRVRLPLVDLRAGRREALTDEGLELGLLVLRMARPRREVDRRGVEANERPDELDQIVGPVGDGLVDRALDGELGHFDAAFSTTRTGRGGRMYFG